MCSATRDDVYDRCFIEKDMSIIINARYVNAASSKELQLKSYAALS